MSRTAGRVALAAVAALGCASWPAVEAHGTRFTPQARQTLLVSRALNGGFPDGPSTHPAFSGDYQLASYLAFQSDASDLVRGDRNRTTDVFIVKRARPFSIRGEPWRPGRTIIVSRGLHGAPANGPSTGPALSGDRVHKPRCVAFVSAASNLVRGDTNRVPDAFVRDLRTGRTTRVSVASDGRQANGPTYSVAVDGSCTRFAFVSSATNLALTRTRSRARQIYVHMSGGPTLLASASARGAAGNADSFDVSLSRLSGRRGAGSELAFASNATNLVAADRTATSDVYLVRLRRRGARWRRTIQLVSAGRSGRPGDGPSTQPAIAAGGRYVFFTTAASDLLANDYNGVTDIARASTARRGTFAWVSRSAAVGMIGDGASTQSSATQPGTVAVFASAAGNLQPSAGSGLFDNNEAVDIFFWSSLSRNVSLESRDSNNRILNNQAAPGGSGHVVQAPAADPAASYYGNYVAFDSPYPLIDLPIAAQRFPRMSSGDAATLSNADGSLRQVYLRYVGPR